MSPSSGDTKTRILDAACELFSRQGYQDTTTQQICEAAEANIAAVHYHFQSKENLYREVWRQLCTDADQRWEEGLGGLESAEDQLRAFVRHRGELILSDGPDGWFARLIHREMSNPTAIHHELVHEHLHPKMVWFFNVVRKLLGPDIDSRTVEAAAFCIHGPLVHLLEMQANAPRPPHPGRPRRHPAKDPERLIETLSTFAFGGLRELARRGGRDTE